MNNYSYVQLYYTILYADVNIKVIFYKEKCAPIYEAHSRGALHKE